MSGQSIDFFEIIKTLCSHEVKFIVVGGVSALLDGAPVMIVAVTPTEQSPERLIWSPWVISS